MKSVSIIGIGKYLPEKIMTNEDIVRSGIDTSDEWIVERTGIKQRHIIASEQASSDMALKASQVALQDAGVSPQEIDLLIVATSTPDHIVFPSTACILQNKLGLRTIGSFDISAACTGFIYAFTTAVQYIKAGYAKKVLVVGSDCLSKYVDWQDRSVCILFGDGAGAVVLSEVEDGFGVLSSTICADGRAEDVLKVDGGGSKSPFSGDEQKQGQQYIRMDGKAVFKVAINKIVPEIINALKKVNLTTKDLNFLIPHQANLRIIKHAREKLGLSEDQVISNLDKYGNTSAASIPIALEEAIQANKIKDGDILALVGFGAGFTWGVNIIRWGGKNG
jgi:3-oxoacyl-[acyl-carrier-protein] synthase III